MPDLDWSEMEGLFCQQAPIAPTSQSGVLSFRLGGQDNSECDKKRKEPTEVKRLFFFVIFIQLIKRCLLYFYSKIHIKISDRSAGWKTKFKC